MSWAIPSPVRFTALSSAGLGHAAGLYGARLIPGRTDLSVFSLGLDFETIGQNQLNLRQIAADWRAMLTASLEYRSSFGLY